jgi:hypothetical protein
MRRSARVTLLVVSLTLAAAGVRAQDSPSGLDRDVVIVGEDRVVLPVSDPAGWAAVELPDLDYHLPAAAPEPPVDPPVTPWTEPKPVQVLALMEASDG